MEGDVSRDTIEKMHAEAGEYHRHFSDVRTHTTSLFVPIALLGTIELFRDCGRIHWLVPLFFIVFTVLTTGFLNVIFWGWSLACRRLETYYEEELEKDGVEYNPERHGFRHLFRSITPWTPAKEQGTESEKAGTTLPKPVEWFNYRKWFDDPFVRGIAVFGVLYLVGYMLLFTTACRSDKVVSTDTLQSFTIDNPGRIIFVPSDR